MVEAEPFQQLKLDFKYILIELAVGNTLSSHNGRTIHEVQFEFKCCYGWAFINPVPSSNFKIIRLAINIIFVVAQKFGKFSCRQRWRRNV